MNPKPELYRVGKNWRMKVKTTWGELHLVPSQYEVELWLTLHPEQRDDVSVYIPAKGQGADFVAKKVQK